MLLQSETAGHSAWAAADLLSCKFWLLLGYLGFGTSPQLSICKKSLYRMGPHGEWVMSGPASLINCYWFCHPQREHGDKWFITGNAKSTWEIEFSNTSVAQSLNHWNLLKSEWICGSGRSDCVLMSRCRAAW